jgi:hypothetical protein
MPTLRRWVSSVTFACALLAAGSVTLAQDAPAGPVLKTGGVELTVGGRVHTQFNTSSVEDVPTTEFLMRRVRLESGIKVNDWVSGRVHLDFAGNRVSLKDAFLRLDLDPALAIIAGHAHRPFGIIVQTSANLILPIERGVRIRGLDDDVEENEIILALAHADRDVGLQLRGAPTGAPLGLFYQAGFFNGPARATAGAEDTYQVVARVGVKPVANVTVAGSFSRRDHAFRDTLLDETFVEDGKAWAVDFEYGGYRPGFHVVAEAAMGDFDPFAGAEFAGAQVWLAYRTPKREGRIEHLEPVFRASWGDPDVDDDGVDEIGGTLLTPALNLYLGGLNRIMFNYDFWNPLSGDRQGSFKTQFNLVF